MENEQIDMSSFLFPRLKITKPIRLIELFAGIGAQSKALERIGADFESYRICEWATPSILAYSAIHHCSTGKDYTEGMTKDEVTSRLAQIGISSDYNKPMTPEQTRRLPEAKARAIYNAIEDEHNLVDISRAHGNDFGIEKQDNRTYTYIMTYSFPCQDLSLAGNQKGMAKGSGTRSGLLWEVERILRELERERATRYSPHGKRSASHRHRKYQRFQRMGPLAFIDGLPKLREHTQFERLRNSAEPQALLHGLMPGRLLL